MKKSSRIDMAEDFIAFFHRNRNGTYVTMKRVGEKQYLLCKGSSIQSMQPSCPPEIKAEREFYKKLIRNDGSLIKSIIFTTAAAAAAFAAGSSVDVMEYWESFLGNKQKSFD